MRIAADPALFSRSPIPVSNPLSSELTVSTLSDGAPSLARHTPRVIPPARANHHSCSRCPSRVRVCLFTVQATLGRAGQLRELIPSWPASLSSPLSSADHLRPLQNITFLHLNDVHAHLDEYRASGTDCPGKEDPSVACLGGYSRILSKVNEIRAGVKDSLLLNAGDEFQGTLFFSYYGSKVISQTLNLLNYVSYSSARSGLHAPVTDLLPAPPSSVSLYARQPRVRPG